MHCEYYSNRAGMDSRRVSGQCRGRKFDHVRSAGGPITAGRFCAWCKPAATRKLRQAGLSLTRLEPISAEHRQGEGHELLSRFPSARAIMSGAS